MARNRTSPHTGHTATGNVRQVRIQRIGAVTVYKRGRRYYLYYRERGRSVRRKVEGNIVTARTLAAKISAGIGEGAPSPFAFTRIDVCDLIDAFVEYCLEVRGLRPRTVERYTAALSHFKAFSEESQAFATADGVTAAAVDDFVKWMRRRRRTRNGAPRGKEASYTDSGICFILSTLRTVFNWAAKRRYLPPYSENPFSSLPMERRRRIEEHRQEILTPDQQARFFEACDDWQRPIFLFLALYGLRAGELTHMLVSDVDTQAMVLHVRSKPEMFWTVKTHFQRTLPVPGALDGLLSRLIAGRREGFLFLNRNYVEGSRRPVERFESPRALRQRLEELAGEAQSSGAETQRDLLRAVGPFLRSMGQIPEKRVRQEFMKVTRKIGCPELTRAHSLRHLFSTRAQEYGVNPILVQGILGHASLEMTRQYTHFDVEAMRQGVGRMIEADPALKGLLREAASPH